MASIFGSPSFCIFRLYPSFCIFRLFTFSLPSLSPFFFSLLFLFRLSSFSLPFPLPSPFLLCWAQQLVIELSFSFPFIILIRRFFYGSEVKIVSTKLSQAFVSLTMSSHLFFSFYLRSLSLFLSQADRAMLCPVG